MNYNIIDYLKNKNIELNEQIKTLEIENRSLKKDIENLLEEKYNFEELCNEKENYIDMRDEMIENLEKQIEELKNKHTKIIELLIN